MDEADSTSTQARARVGTLLNARWRLDRLLGVGGMAAVYAATHHRNAKRVAIKILHREISADDNARQRFLREGYAANQIGHRGAVTADDDGLTEDGVAFLVMELLEGETLEERAQRQGGRLTGREVLALMDQALATLEAAHQKGIIHRDLKPENLFLTRDGLVKVLDFGIARVGQAAGASPSQTQGIMGTPSYMAPEQARGRWDEVDARADLWAIGATMFSLLSGRFVHEAETANEALVLAVTQRARSVSSVVPDAHPALVSVVDKALAYEREARFQSAAELRAALRSSDAQIAAGETPPSLSVPLPSTPSVPQARALGETATGLASSVRTAPSEPKRSIKRSVIALSLLAFALVGWFGRGLFHDTRQAASFEATTVAALRPVAAGAATEHAPTAIAAAPSPTSPSAAASSAAPETAPPPRAAAPRKPSAASTRAISSKTVAAKSAAELLKKRH
jgi:serine/threonine protein kinase